jgi:hypothetical protein
MYDLNIPLIGDAMLNNKNNPQHANGLQRRSFLGLAMTSLVATQVNAQQRNPTCPVESDDEVDKISAADSLLVYSELLEDIRRSTLEYEVDELSKVKNEVSAGLQRILDSAFRVNKNNPTPQSLNDLLDDIERTEELKRRFDIEREKRLSEIRQLDNRINEIREIMLTACALLKPAETAGQQAERGANINEASKMLNRAVERLNQLPGASTLGSNNAVANLVQILKVVDKSIKDPSRGSSSPTRGTHSAHAFVNQLNESAAKERVKSIIREQLPPGVRLQVWWAFAAVWRILTGVGEKSTRQRLIRDALKVVPSWGGNKDQAAELLSNITFN